MRFAILGSGSRGNAMLVEAGDTCVLIDCGFSVKETEKRLSRLNKTARDIDAILVTHEHGDHITGVGALARKYDIAVYATRGTFQCERFGTIAESVYLHCEQLTEIKALSVLPYTVPHDAREPSQFVISDGANRLGLLTDVGSCTPHIVEQLNGCDALVLECNHDSELLANGDYSYSLKQRVGGNFGHLNNDQSCEVLLRMDTSRLQHIVAAHLSEKHNSPELVRRLLSTELNCEQDWIAVADQVDGLDWRCLV